MIPLLFISIFLLALAEANLQSFQHFKLLPQMLQQKSRFVFSDRSDEPLENAFIQFDFMVRPRLYSREIQKDAGLEGESLTFQQKADLASKTRERLRLYVLVANSSVARQVVNTLQEYRDDIDELGIKEILKKLEPRLTFYQTIDVDQIFIPAQQKKNVFTERVNITTEGVYYTYLIYEKVPVIEAGEGRNYIIEDEDDPANHHLLHAGGFDLIDLQLSGGHRRLALDQKATMEEASLLGATSSTMRPHLEVTGSIEFKNSAGYLNAEQAPFLTFFPILALVFGMMLFFWVFHLIQYKVLSLHYFVLIVIVVTLFQCLFTYGDYAKINAYGKQSGTLLVMAFALDVVRSTMSKVVTLLVGLGYGLTTNSMDFLATKIMILSAVYSISLAAFNGVQYMNHQTQISGPVAFIVSFPLALVNSAFCLWIYLAFRKSMRELRERNQVNKLRVISQLYYVICAGIVGAFLLYIFDFYLMVSESRDENWNTQWLREQWWFWIFTLGMLGFIIILRPNEHTKDLASMTEVNDDAKTEHPEEDLEDQGIEMKKMHEGQDFNPSGRRSSMDDGHAKGIISLTSEPPNKENKDIMEEEYAQFKRQREASTPKKQLAPEN